MSSRNQKSLASVTESWLCRHNRCLICVDKLSVPATRPVEGDGNTSPAPAIQQSRLQLVAVFCCVVNQPERWHLFLQARSGAPASVLPSRAQCWLVVRLRPARSLRNCCPGVAFDSVSGGPPPAFHNRLLSVAAHSSVSPLCAPGRLLSVREAADRLWCRALFRHHRSPPPTLCWRWRRVPLLRCGARCLLTT